MDTLDPTIVRTVLLVAGFLYVLCPLVAWALLVDQRNRQVALWCGGGLLIAAGSFSFASKGVLPDWVALIGANLIVMLANVMRIQSLRMDLGRPYSLSSMAGFLLAMGFLTAVIYYGLGNNLLRAIVTSVVHIAMLGFLSYLAWCIARQEKSRSALWLSGVYALLACGGMMRISPLLIQAPEDPTMVAGGWYSLILVITVITAAVVGHFGYVGLVLDRVRRREVALTAERVREEERRELSQQIAHLDRQRSLSELSTSLAHEINQPLGAIVTHVHVGKRGIETGQLGIDKLASVLEKIGASAVRASQIIDRIRGYIKPSEADMQAVNLVQVIESVTALVEHDVEKGGVRLQLQAPPRGVWVRGDAIQLSQIVLNGLRNALEALQTTKRPQIRIDCFRRAGLAIVRIEDNGPGLTTEQLSHVGQPFFTSKPHGLGVGFSISRTIAQQHGGTLTLNNLAALPNEPAVAEAPVCGAVLELALPEGPPAEATP